MAFKLLGFLFGYILNKGRDEVAKIFLEGDVIELEVRKLIIRDIDEVKSSCSALARTDITACCSFLKEGIALTHRLMTISTPGSEELRAVFGEVIF